MTPQKSWLKMERYRLEEYVCNTCKLKKINPQSLQRTVRKMQIIILHPVGITPVRHHFIPRRWAKMKKSDKVKCWQERTPEHLHFAVGSLNQNTGFWKQSGIIWWSWRCTYLWPSHLTPRYRMFQRNSWACVPGDKNIQSSMRNNPNAPQQENAYINCDIQASVKMNESPAINAKRKDSPM